MLKRSLNDGVRAGDVPRGFKTVEKYYTGTFRRC